MGGGTSCNAGCFFLNNYCYTETMKLSKEHIDENRLKKITDIVKKRQADIIVVIEDVHDPHNAAAILRSCDAFGVQHVYFIFDKIKPYNPAKIGKATSSSANKWLTFTTFNSARECHAKLKKMGYSSYGAVVSQKANSFYETDFTQTQKVALWIGNEHSGLSTEAQKLIEHHVYIPMQGMVESFNVSVAAALCIFEITRQRKAGKGIPHFSKEEQEKFIDDFINR